MALGRWLTERQESLFMEAEELPCTEGRNFYTALNELLSGNGVDRLCEASRICALRAAAAGLRTRPKERPQASAALCRRGQSRDRDAEGSRSWDASGAAGELCGPCRPSFRSRGCQQPRFRFRAIPSRAFMQAIRTSRARLRRRFTRSSPRSHTRLFHGLLTSHRRAS